MSAVNRSPGLRAAFKVAGSARALARKLGISHVAILRWSKVPAEYIVETERLIGVPREILRPDLYHHRLAAKDDPLLLNDSVALALDGVALLITCLHVGVPLETIRDELREFDSDTQLTAIVERVLSGSERGAP